MKRRSLDRLYAGWLGEKMAADEAVGRCHAMPIGARSDVITNVVRREHLPRWTEYELLGLRCMLELLNHSWFLWTT